MSTSANVIEFTIFKNEVPVGSFRKHLMCILPKYSELLKYQPLSEHTILTWGYDEEEEYWESDGGPENLEDFLKRKVSFEKEIREYFK
jgi:hypothetical protein